MNVSRSSAVRQAKDQVSTELEGEVVIMGVDQGNYYNLDLLGSRIWQLIEHPVPVSRLCEHLQEEFEVEPEVCEQDVLRFLDQLAREGLVEVVER